jgi:hypothetical protein
MVLHRPFEPARVTGQLALPRFHISGNRGNQDLRRQLMAHAEVPLSMSAKMF